MNYYDNTSFSDLVGKTFDEITYNGDRVRFKGRDAEGSEVEYQMLHHQDCCESVYLADGADELTSLQGSPILFAEETSGEERSGGEDVGTWTFYKLRTASSDVTLRWYGSSNGYYSTAVSFEKI